MKAKFLRFLGLFLAIALLAAIFGSFFFLFTINKEHLRENALSQMTLIQERMILNDQQIEDLTQTYNDTSIAKARAFAEIVDQNPSIIESTEEMIRIAELLMVDEVHVTDEDGVLWWGNIVGYYGFDFATSEQTAPFMAILEDPTLEMAQEPQPNGATGKLFQYTSVARADAKGIIQVGMSPLALEEFLANAAVPNVLKDYTIDAEGYAFAIDASTGSMLAWPDNEMIGKSSEEIGIPDSIVSNQRDEGTLRYDDTEYFYISQPLDDMIIGFTIPNAKLYTSQLQAVLSFAILNVVIFLLLMVAISRLLQVHVITGIKYVTSKIREVAAGNLTVNLALSTNKEFASLSDDINSMVSKIKQSLDHVEEKAEENMEMLQQQKQMFNEVKKVSADIQEYSSSIRTMSEKLDNGSKLQKNSIGQLLANMENLNAKTIDSTSISEEVTQQTELSLTSIATMNSQLQGMLDSVEAMSRAVSKIEGIINNINSIASETNMLSLNASIEAARAGETGKGFAVVADQVGKLAGASKQAANETTTLINELLNTVQSSQQMAEKTKTEFQVVSDAVKMNGELITKLAQISGEQAGMIKSARQGVEEISDVAQNNDRISEGSMTTSDLLSNQANHLSSLVKK
ncbi:MAG: methyl-accepting chemotaxis protein [Lachnospiraceae bacterium]|jgi:methyl-accepting chemotaxis protein|nr:methyl-accepting chemotaxis protein [Lachnospiraceae bacterium]